MAQDYRPTFDTRPARRLYSALTDLRNPMDLRDIAIEDCLTVLLGNAEAAASILRYCQGDIRRLADRELRVLQTLPYTGEATTARLACAFRFTFEVLEGPRKAAPAD
ncbi:MAG: hypothetical protein C4289_03920 [Chloroflexota bacterium]